MTNYISERNLELISISWLLSLKPLSWPFKAFQPTCLSFRINELNDSMRESSAERYEGFFLESRMTEGLLAYLFPPVPPHKLKVVYLELSR